MTPPANIQTRPTGDRRYELERIKAATWPEQGKDEQIARAVAAIDGLRLPAYYLDPETWKYIAESPGVYDDDEA
jgi:hypothetical protein